MLGITIDLKPKHLFAVQPFCTKYLHSGTAKMMVSVIEGGGGLKVTIVLIESVNVENYRQPLNILGTFSYNTWECFKVTDSLQY